jgi:hypothetical protein
MTTLPPSCADFLKFWSLSLLEPQGPVQACSGTALPLKLVGIIIAVLRRTFGLVRDEVRREWRRRNKEELYDLYSHQILFA